MVSARTPGRPRRVRLTPTVAAITLAAINLCGCQRTSHIAKEEARISELIQRINVTHDPLHGNYTPAVEELVEIGAPAVLPLLEVQLTESSDSRLRAQTALELIVARMYGFERGEGWGNKQQEHEFTRLLENLGPLEWDAPAEKRKDAVQKWRTWWNSR